jgi:hypothetical protein
VLDRWLVRPGLWQLDVSRVVGENSEAMFNRAKFDGVARYDDAQFTGNAMFRAVQFADHVLFALATLPDIRYVDEGTLSSWTDFGETRFTRAVPPEVAQFVTLPVPDNPG